jgi:N-acetylneuraminate lyase
MVNLDSVRGVVLPLPTPFDGQGNVDEQLLAAMAEHYVNLGVRSLFLFGSFGQGPAMTAQQRRHGLEVVLAAVGARATVIPQIGAVDPYSSRELAEHALQAGAPVLGTVGPYYYADRSPDEIRRHLGFVFADITAPVLLYNNARYQGYDITAKQMVALRSEVPTIFAVKMAKGTLADLQRHRAALGDDVKLFAPQENLFPGMLIGQAGSISPPMSAVAELGLALVAAIDAGQTEEALRLQLAVLRYAAQLQQLSAWGRGVRAESLRYIGFPVKEYPRWPTEPMPAEGLHLLHEAIDTARAAVAGAV